MLQVIPPNSYLLGDAGYTLADYMMTPYTISPTMTQSESTYNYIHSSTRMVIEMAFGLLKGKFAVFKTPLTLKTHSLQGKMIVAAMVLHNWLIYYNEPEDENIIIDNEGYDVNDQAIENEDEGLYIRDALKDYLQELEQ